MEKPKVTVIGSANVDFVTQTDYFPRLGETLLGNDIKFFPGGKGANQAVAAARLGGDVTFIGCVGKDNYAKLIREKLYNEKINLEYLYESEMVGTGIANIIVSENDNAIIVIPGANYQLTPGHIKSLKEVVLASDIIILQLEIPINTIKATVEIANSGDIPIVLNPAPAIPLPEDLMRKVTYITPNETELSLLTGENDIEKSFNQLYNIGVKNVILTQGDKGVIYGNPKMHSLQFFKASKVEVIDTTGAGDTFNAAFALSIANGKQIYESIGYANIAAGLSITTLGAQEAMPYKKEVDKIYNKNMEEIK